MRAGAGGPDRRRAGEDDRDAAVRRVQEAYAQGHLSHEELDEHLRAALTATTRGELASVLASLPGENTGEGTGEGAVENAGEGAGGGAVENAGEGTGTASTIAAVSGRILRRGAWRVPRTLRVESALARVRLDLSRAVIEHPVVDIELHLGAGGARITVPRDAIVEVEDLRAGWREPHYRAPRSSRAGGPRIRISGAMGLGRLRIRHAWR